VVIRGKSYPNSDVRVLIDGKVVGIVRSDSRANFHFETVEITPGVTTFGLWSEDEKGLKSTLFTVTFRVASKSITTISNVYISPTIDVDKKKVKKGDSVKIFGKSSPEIDIKVHIHSENNFVEGTGSDNLGDWSIDFDTKDLEEDFHTAKALMELATTDTIIQSNFSRTVSFFVGENIESEGECKIADLNCDDVINLVDFSILLYNWGRDNPEVDVNNDGKIGLVDFSIMMFHWTG